MNVLVMPRGKDWIVKIEGRKIAYAVIKERDWCGWDMRQYAINLGMHLAKERKVALVVMNDAGEVVEKKNWWLVDAETQLVRILSSEGPMKYESLLEMTQEFMSQVELDRTILQQIRAGAITVVAGEFGLSKNPLGMEQM